MSASSDLSKLAADVLLAVGGVTVTYTEAGGSAQTVTALSENFSQDGDTATKTFKFETTDLTIANWRGAKILDTGGDGTTYTIQEKEDSPGVTRFRATRAVERS